MSAHQKGKHPEKSKTEVVDRQGKWEGGGGDGIGRGFFFSCLGISLVLTVHLSYEKPWAGGSLTLLFSISLVVVLFHNMAMEDLQLGQIYSLSSCQPRQRARNSALYSKVHRTLHFWEKNQACLRVRVHTLFSDSYICTDGARWTPDMF